MQPTFATYSDKVDCIEFPNGGSRYRRVPWVHINPHNNIHTSNQTPLLTSLLPNWFCYSFCCIHNPMDETKRQSPTYHLMELLLWPYTYPTLLPPRFYSSLSRTKANRRWPLQHSARLLPTMATPSLTIRLLTSVRHPISPQPLMTYHNIATFRDYLSPCQLKHLMHRWRERAAGRCGGRRPTEDKVTRPAAPACSHGCPWPLGGSDWIVSAALSSHSASMFTMVMMHLRANSQWPPMTAN